MTKARTAKSTIYAFFNKCGFNVIARSLHRKQLRIFALHGVANYDSDIEWTPLRPQMDVGKFRECMQSLALKYHFVSLSDAVKMLSGEIPLMPNCAVLTFDDGYRNNFTEALPVLRELSLPAEFYVATDYIEERKPFWFDRLDFIVQQAAAKGLRVELNGFGFETSGISRTELRKKFADLRSHTKKIMRDEKQFVASLDSLATELESLTDCNLQQRLEDDPWADIVSIDQLREESNDGLASIGSHTLTHLRLACADEQERRRELSLSKSKIEQWTGNECEHFSYPNGEYDELSCRLVSDAGYKSAVTSVFGMNQIGCDLFKLKRLNVFYDAPLTDYLARASGLEDIVNRLKTGVQSFFSRSRDVGNA